MKNIKTNVTENIDFCNEERITIENALKILIPSSILVIVLSLLLYKFVFMPIVIPIIGTPAQSFLPIVTIMTLLSTTIVQSIDLYEQNRNQRIAKQEIVELQKELKEKGLNYTKKEIINADIYEIEYIKDKVRKDGVKTKRKKVTNYILIDSKTKLSVIKETITYYKKMREEITETILLEKEDLQNEGIIDKNGFLTEKGKALILNKND